MLIKEKLQTHKFSPTEQVIADYILEHPEQIADMTVQEIAEQTYAHPSTLIRIAKKLGYSGWLELKTAYLEEWRYLDQHFSKIDANFPFTSSDGIMTIAKKIAALEQMTIEDTLSLIHHDELQKAKQMLLNAQHIKIFGSNANSLISQDFVLKMKRIEKDVAVAATIGENIYEAYNCPENTCAILISYTGENSGLLRVIQVLQERNIPTIAITSIGENQIAANCTCVLPITTREKLYSKIGNFTINTSICYLLDVLYSVVFAEHYQKNLNHLIQVGQVVDKRKSSINIIQESKSSDLFTVTDSRLPN